MRFRPRAYPHLLSPSGFTLAEMMVTVGIVGLLAAVTIPSYQKYSARMKQSEAKVELAAIYTAEKNYSADARTYTVCVDKIGVPSYGQTRFYASGIYPVLGATQMTCGTTANKDCSFYLYDEGAPVAGSACSASPDGLGGYPSGAGANVRINASIPLIGSGASMGSLNSTATIGTNVSNNTFTAAAAGNVSSASLYDKWEIDNTQSLINRKSGL